jgi:hypothetical protein
VSTTAPDSHVIDVDTMNETATVTFVDSHGNAVPAPDGAAVTFSSSDESIATIALDSVNLFQGNITPLTPGQTDIGADVTGVNDSSGNPLPDPDAVGLTVNPGAAAGERLTVGPAAAPPPAPADAPAAPADVPPPDPSAAPVDPTVVPDPTAPVDPSAVPPDVPPAV